MDPDGGVCRKKFKNFLGLVRTQIIGNDVDLALCGLTPHYLCKEIDELGAGVACGSFS